MFRKDVRLTKVFTGWADEQLRSIQAPALVINGSKDVGSPEHAVSMYCLLPYGELAVFPGGPGAYLGVVETLANAHWSSMKATGLLDEFLG